MLIKQMKTLFTIDLKNYKEDWQRSRRDSARAIIHMGSDKLALVYATKLGYYKFPGGGINENEDKVEALIREVQEEVGLVVIPQTVKEYGVVHRYQKSGKIPDTIFEQDNFYYECQVEEKIINQKLDDYEDKAGFELRVVSIKEALEANLKYRDTNDFNIAMIARDTRTLAMMLGVPVEPSRCMAELLFNEGVAKNPGPWREHSLAVARAAEKIALAVNKNCGQEKLNPEHAYIYGLLHDIGRQEGYTYIAHVYDGYHFLMSLGYENAARICLTHSFNLQTTDDYIGKIDITPEKMEEIKRLLAAVKYDDYDRLIQLLDSTCGADGTVNLEQRMGDVKARYGYYPQPKWNKNFELKAYFEKLAGSNFYNIIRGKKMRLIFIRHGDPDYEHDDLTPKGKHEVELLTKRVCSWKNIAAFYQSPLGRAKATAAPVLAALGREATTCNWLQEFKYKTRMTKNYPNKFWIHKDVMCWDLLPEFYTSDKNFFDKDRWADTKFMRPGKIKKYYKEVCDGIDGILAQYGYIRNKKDFYDVKIPVPNHNWSEPINRYHLKSIKDDYPEETTLVFFCHLGVMFAMIAHLTGLSPMQLWQGFYVAPTSITILNSEERLEGQAWFRVERLGDTNHLTNGGEPISSSGYFANILDEN